MCLFQALQRYCCLSACICIENECIKFSSADARFSICVRAKRATSLQRSNARKKNERQAISPFLSVQDEERNKDSGKESNKARKSKSEVNALAESRNRAY